MLNTRSGNRRLLLSMLVAVALLAACSGDGNINDPLFPPDTTSAVDPFAATGTFLGVLPPGSGDGNDGNINANPNSTDQRAMYENLAFSDNYPTAG